jgi:UPF0755 protein
VTRPPVRGDHEYDDEWADRDEWYEDDPDADYEALGGDSPRGRRILLVLGAIVLVFLVVLGVAFVYVKGRLDPGGALGEPVLFTVETGMSADGVATKLEDEGIIEDAQLFRLYLRYKGTDGFQAGDYDLFENMAAWDVVEVLSGPPRPRDTAVFEVPPGLTLAQVPAAIVDDIPGFDAAALSAILTEGTIRPQVLPPEATTLEGFLFPDRYDILLQGGPEAAIQRMAEQFDTVAGELDLVNRAAALGHTPYEVVTVASLIEEEYGIQEEMDKIARVIYNRLDIGEPLGIDATSRYEAELAGRDRNDIDLGSDSPYNTRRQAGLPPTPIALPSRAALEAALAPADGPWIFYVRDPDESRTPAGGHFFTDSASEFARVKAECEEANLGCG